MLAAIWGESNHSARIPDLHVWNIGSVSWRPWYRLKAKRLSQPLIIEVRYPGLAGSHVTIEVNKHFEEQA